MSIQLTINGKHSEDSKGVALVNKTLDEVDTFFDLEGVISDITHALYMKTGIPSFSKLTCEVTDQNEWTLNVEA